MRGSKSAAIRAAIAELGTDADVKDILKWLGKNRRNVEFTNPKAAYTQVFNVRRKVRLTGPSKAIQSVSFGCLNGLADTASYVKACGGFKQAESKLSELRTLTAAVSTLES